MTFSMILAGTDEHPLASIGGWNDFTRWADELEPEQFPELVHLADHGFTQNVPGLTTEIEAARTESPPDDETVDATIDVLVGILAEMPEGGESAFVTDGNARGDDELSQMAVAFREEEHPRANDGKFDTKEGGGKSGYSESDSGSDSPKNHPVKSWAAKKFENPEHAKAFVEWFGDSKVVDEKGEPLVVYHGTNAEFEKFEDGGNKRRGAVLGYGSYFTTEPDRAAAYAGEEGGSHLKPVFLAIKNPMILDGDLTQNQSDSLGRELARHATNKEMLSSPRETSPEMGKDEAKAVYQEKLNEWKEHGGDVFRTKPKINRNGDKFSIEYTDTSRASVSRNAAEAFRDISFAMGPDSSSVLASAGFDGVKRGDEYVAFSPSQIKSATGNVGTFDPKNNRIDMSLPESQ